VTSMIAWTVSFESFIFLANKMISEVRCGTFFSRGVGSLV
jgi:hypothetical protein